MEDLFIGASPSSEPILNGFEPVQVDLKHDFTPRRLMIDDSTVLAQSVPTGHTYMIYTYFHSAYSIMNGFIM